MIVCSSDSIGLSLSYLKLEICLDLVKDGMIKQLLSKGTDLAGSRLSTMFLYSFLVCLQQEKLETALYSAKRLQRSPYQLNEESLCSFILSSVLVVLFEEDEKLRWLQDDLRKMSEECLNSELLAKIEPESIKLL